MVALAPNVRQTGRDKHAQDSLCPDDGLGCVGLPKRSPRGARGRRRGAGLHLPVHARAGGGAAARGDRDILRHIAVGDEARRGARVQGPRRCADAGGGHRLRHVGHGPPDPGGERQDPLCRSVRPLHRGVPPLHHRQLRRQLRFLRGPAVRGGRAPPRFRRERGGPLQAGARRRQRAIGACRSRTIMRRPTSGRSIRKARFSASCRSRTPAASKTSTTCSRMCRASAAS